MQERRYALGIDLGGTNLKIAAITEAGELLRRESVPVGEGKSIAQVVGLIAQAAQQMRQAQEGELIGIGCGIPGIIDAERGMVYASPNFPAWRDEPIQKMLSDATGVRLCIDNDANYHALGEAHQGAGRGKRNCIMLTLGTGIGGGIILDHRVFHGDSGFAGEVGHIVVERDGVPCGCSGHGCLEQYAASRGFSVMASRLAPDQREELVRAAQVSLEELEPRIMSDLAEQGHAIALSLWNEFGTYLGMGIATLVNVLGVMTIIVGGGIAKSWEKFIEATISSARSHTFQHYAQRLTVRRAELGDDAGVIGAASDIVQRISRGAPEVN